MRRNDECRFGLVLTDAQILGGDRDCRQGDNRQRREGTARRARRPQTTR
jgi:hypothetical protein